MKRVLCAAVMIFAGVSAYSQKQGPEYTELTEKNHPRLFFSENDFKRLRKEVEAGGNATLCVLDDKMMHLAKTQGLSDKEIDFDPERDKSTFNSVARRIAARIVSDAYGYRMTGEKEYLEHAISNIDLFADNFRDWTTNYYLENSELCYSFAIAYDWLYKDLPKKTLKKMVDAIESVGYDDAADPKKSSFYSSEGNWNPVCNACLVCAAIATYEKHPERSAQIIEKAIQTVPTCLGSLFEPDGASPEGPSYWDYAVIFASQLCMVLEDNFGSDFGLTDFNGFRGAYKFRMFAVSNTGGWFNYGDCNPKGAETCMALWYYAWKFGRTDILFRDVKALPDARISSPRGLPMAIACALRLGKFKTSVPEELLLTCRGTANLIIARGGWSKKDAYLGVKGGKGKAGHSHLDEGSFIYEADGVRWADEFVHPKYELYRRASRALKKEGKSFKWYDKFVYNNRRHSTLTVNDTDMKETGSALIVDSFDTPERRGGSMDLTEMLEGEVAKAVRTAALIDGHDLEISDAVTALPEKKALVRWTLVTGADIEITPEGIVLSSKGKKMLVKADFPVSYKTWSADPADYDDNPVRKFEAEMEKYPLKLCGFEYEVPASEEKTVTVRFSSL